MSTVALTIDYSNGAQKHFSNIPWKKGLTILSAIQASQGIVPGVAIEFGSDRAAHVIRLTIDALPSAETEASEWLIWVDAKPFTRRLGTEESFGFFPDEREANLLKAGDQVLLKLSSIVEKPAE